MIYDIFLNACKNILKRKTRSWLTILGIIIGIAAIVSLILIGGGLRSAIVGEFESIGTNRLVILGADANIMSGSPTLANSGYGKDYINSEWLDKISSVKGVISTGGVYGSIALIEGTQDYISVNINGIPKDQRTVIGQENFNIKLLEGRLLRRNDKNSVIINTQVQEKIDKKINEKIEINGKGYKIVGIYESSGFGGQASVLFMPIEEVYAISKSSKPNELNSIFVIYDPSMKSDYVIDEISKNLRRYLRQDEGEESFQIQSYEEFLKMLDSILGVINYILIGIAMISTLVGAIGIMNSLFTSVMERKREIGIMKSIGARNYMILIMFVFESILFSIIGGVIGVITGIGLAKLVENIAFKILGTRLISIVVDFNVLLFALLFALIVGVLSGYLPAKRASKMKPVDSLQG